jgi:hypothetical protein
MPPPPNILLFQLPPSDEVMDLYRSLSPPGIPCLFNAICILTALSNKKTSKAITNDMGNGTMDEIANPMPHICNEPNPIIVLNLFITIIIITTSISHLLIAPPLLLSAYNNLIKI